MYKSKNSTDYYCDEDTWGCGLHELRKRPIYQPSDPGRETNQKETKTPEEKVVWKDIFLITRIRKDFYKLKICVLPASLNAKEYVIKDEDFISSTLRTQRKEKLTQT